MRTPSLVLSLAVLLSACGGDSSNSSATPANSSLSASSSAVSAAQLAQIDAYVQAQMQRHHLPGLALVVTLDGKPVLEKGYGDANIASGVKVTPDTVFQLASLTKQFTATAIMILVQDGRLNLDDPVTRHLPTAPAAWGDITIRHLLNHTSGLARDFPRELVEPLFGKPLPPIDTLVALAGEIPRIAAAGAVHEYSNVGYHLLGFVIEKASGLHFAELLRRRVFAPLGMHSAGMISAPLPATAATGYQWNGTALQPASGLMMTPGLVEAEGGLRMSARDLAKWDAGLIEGGVLTRASLAQMHAPTRLNDGSEVRYGFGWGLDAINGHPYTWHNGMLEGFRSQFTRHTSQGLAVVVLVNATEAPVAAITSRVSAILKPQLDWDVRADPQPALGQLLTTLLDEVSRGALVVDERFAPSLRANLRPELVAAIHARFAGWGAVGQSGYVDDVVIDGVTLRRYLLRTAHDEALVVARLDADGRLAVLSFSGQ